MSELPPESEEANAPKFRQSDIATAWGCSLAYVSKCKGKGMPVHSLEAADEWRAANAAGRGTGFRSKGQGGQNRADSLADSNRFGTEDGAPPPARRPKSLKSVDASLKGAVEIEEAARRQVTEATRKQEDSRLPNLIAAYNKAREGRYDSEERVLELLEKAGTLIPLSDAKAAVAKILGTLFSRLRAAPAKAGPKANPVDDLLAEGVFRNEIETAIGETHAIALTALGITTEEIVAAAA